MNARSTTLAHLTLFLLLGHAAVAAAQDTDQVDCPEGALNQPRFLKLLGEAAGDLLAKKAQEESDSPEKNLAEEVVLRGDKEPLVTQSTQMTAPSATGESTSLVNGATFPSILALALDNNLLQAESNAFTASLNFFAFKALANPEIMDVPTEYDKYMKLRRWNGSLSFGGKGETFDRDGDGEADEALESKNLDDIVTWELRFRLKGSRDRRDRNNYPKYLHKLGELHALDEEARKGFFLRHAPDLIAIRSGNCFDAEKAKELLAKPEIAAKILAIAVADKTLKEAAEKGAKEIDTSFIMTLVLGGVEREEEFGPDKLMGALRSSWGKHTLDLEYSESEGLMVAPDPQQWRLGYKYSTFVWKDRSFFGKDGVGLTWAAAYELSDDVPDAKHDDIIKVSGKLEFPITKGVTVPVSVTWANHKDLLEDEDEVIAHLGFSIDLSKLMKKDDKASGGS